MKKCILIYLNLIIFIFLLSEGFICDIVPVTPETPKQEEEKPFLGGEVRSRNSFKYGRFVIRMKPNPISGVISSFFTYYCVDPDDSCKKSEEIDIEFIGANKQSVQFNYHHPTEISKSQHSYTCQLNFMSNSDFHIYTFEWTKTYLAWFIDNTEKYRVQLDPQNPLSELQHHQFIMMNIWPPKDNWAGSLNSGDLPISVFYDWVKHFPWNENSGFATNPDFEDNFNSFDDNKWEKGTSTFKDNNSVFVRENVSVSNGMLILTLTPREGRTIQGACQEVFPSYNLGQQLTGKQAHGYSGDFSCYSDIYTVNGIRISPYWGEGRAWYIFGPVDKNSLIVTYQWVDNAWYSDLKALEIFNFSTGNWERIAQWYGNDGKEHIDSKNIILNNNLISSNKKIKIALFGASNSVIHLNTIKVE